MSGDAADMDLTLTDWLEALRVAGDVSVTDDDAVTISELAQQWGHSSLWVRTRLREYQARGEITITPVQVRRQAFDGRMTRVAGYRIRRIDHGTTQAREARRAAR